MPVEKAPPRPRVYIHGPLKPFQSPIDGSAIESTRDYKEHMRKHNVVPTGEFGENFGEKWFERKAKERAAYYDGESETLRKEVRADLDEAVRMVSQGYKPKVESEAEIVPDG